MSPVDPLLARLEGVRRSGKGWSARCPAHQDRTASLSIADGDDSRVLVHCFAGCPVVDVLAAVGLDLAALFPARVRGSGPMARAQRREAARQGGWDAALRVLERQALVVEIAASMLARGDALTTEELDRVHDAAVLIYEAREALAVPAPQEVTA